MEEKNKKRQIAKITVFITSIFVIFMSITYAFITQTLTGTKEVVINAGVLDLVLEEENAITISDALPMYDEVGMIQEDVFVFRLVNKTSNPTNYILKLQEIETGTLDKSIVKYGLIKEEEKTINLVSDMVNGVIDEGIIAGNDTLDYELRLWIDSSVSEIPKLKNKFLNFKLSASVNQDIMFVKALDDIVIDFGLPVEVKYSKLDEGTIIEDLSYATYGKVEIDGDSSEGDFTVRYTPTEMLQDVDTIHLITEDNKEYTFNVIPATTMYYEENFEGLVTYNSGKGLWEDQIGEQSQYNRLQEGNIVGAFGHSPYGFDQAYLNDCEDSNGTSKHAFTKNGAVQFVYKFTGTKTSFYVRSTNTSGFMKIVITDDSTGELVQSLFLDSRYYDPTNTLVFYNVPIFISNDFSYGTYTVTVTVAKETVNLNYGSDFWLDGIRVYNPVNINKNNDIINKAYLLDNEAYPEYFGIADNILNSDSLDETSTEYEGVIFIGGTENDSTKNEVYLSNDKKVAFKLKNLNNQNIASIQLGVNSLFGKDTMIEIYEYGKERKKLSIRSTMNMYYDITDIITWRDNTSGLIVIESNSLEDAIASITNLKITYKNDEAGKTSAVISREDIDSLS